MGAQSVRSCAVAALVIAAAASFAGATPTGRVVVGHDANTLSSTKAGTTEAQFAINIASWLTANQPGEGNVGKSILLVQSSTADARHNISPVVSQALAQAGYSVTVTTSHNQTVSQLTQYNAIFTSLDFDNAYAFQNASDLTQFVQQGGGVYVWAGMGPRTDVEVATLNPFLETIGLKFSEQMGGGLGGGNGIYGHTVTGNHPILNTITGSWLASQNGGTSILTTGTVPSAQVIESFNGYGIYAVSEGVIPTPGTTVLGIAGAALMIRRRR